MKTKGILLEGGGMRGIYTTGVIDYFIENNISFNYILGVSAGACHGASLASKQYKRAYISNTKYLKGKDYLSLRNWFKTGSAFNMDFLFNKIPNELYLYDKETFFKSNVTMEMCVTNIDTGKAEYFPFKDPDSDIIYMQASSSLPIISKIVEVDDKKLLDGGIADSIPLDRLLLQNLDKNIIVLTRDLHYRKKDSNSAGIISLIYKRYPKMIDALKNRNKNYNARLEEILKLEQEGKVFVIRPSKPLKVSKFEKNLEVLEQLYNQGYSDAKALEDKLKEYLIN